MNLHGMVFRLVGYIFFGIVMEVLVSSITSMSRCGWNAETKKMTGSVSIYMALIYGPLLLFAFEPLAAMLAPLEYWVQFLIYGIVFQGIEFIAGAVLDKVFKIKLWDYSGLPGSLCGYTHLDLFWKWGFAGIMLASYSTKLQSIIF